MATQPQNWEKIKALFQEALELGSSARSAFLADKCGDPEIRTEVERLLAEHTEASGFLSTPVFYDLPLGGDVPPEEHREFPHGGSLEPTTTIDMCETTATVIGRYHLLQKIGEGGMGEVWQAEQKEPMRRRVALKLIRTGLNTHEAMARFESERQALAMMEHPTIAKVFDAGATLQGAPYFVMEYVAGIPITDYCDKHRLSTSERLELFAHVCEGVQHAHQKAIIHRDLKPSNILVTEVDGKPVPKIIDFGLAKAMAQKLTADTIFTRVGALIGTPEYMSPEQASSAGEDIDTRTDVYSLGIIFYELLAGVPPIDSRKIAFEEFLRRLREEDPPKPSTRFSTQDPATSTEVARKRQTEPQALAKQLRGELDSIALKALEKERPRRYASASEFAADIKRYLNHEAVLAVAPSLGYRVRKFARRYRVALATAGTVVLVLAVAAVVSIRQSIRANREAALATQEAAVAEAVNDFLQNDLLAQAGASAQSGPTTKPDPDLKVRTALDRAAERIEGKFAKQPEVEASIRDTMGQAYTDLGLYPEARKQLERAMELRRQVLGAEDARTLKSIVRIGSVALLQGRYAEAEALESHAWEAQHRTLGPEHPDTLTSMNHLAAVYTSEGKYAQAEALYTRTLEIQKRVLGPEHPDTLLSMSKLAWVYGDEGKYPQAEALDVQTLEIQKRVLGPEHPDTLTSMNNLAWVYLTEGKYRQAEVLLSQTVEIRKQILGPEHSSTLTSMTSLANVYRIEGKYAQAEVLLSQTLEIQKRVLGPEHPNTLSSMSNLALACENQGNYVRAEGLDVQTLEIRKRVLGPEHPDTLESMNNLANVYVHEAKYAESEALYTQTLEIQKRRLGPEHPYTALTLYNMSCLAARRGDRDQAIALLKQSVDHGLSPVFDLGIEADTDLTSLHIDPRFVALVEHAKHVAEAKTKAAAIQAAK
jgi:eukaryotic-like serine/threonine-protein kinase